MACFEGGGCSALQGCVRGSVHFLCVESFVAVVGDQLLDDCLHATGCDEVFLGLERVAQYVAAGARQLAYYLQVHACSPHS